MFRQLYKTFLISIICGSLSTMNMTAFAEETGGTSGSGSNMQRAQAPQGLTRGSDGVYTKTETRHFEGTKDKDDNAIHAITMFVVAFIGVKLLTYKKWTLDMSMVAVGSAAYIAAEIINIMNLKKQISDMDVQLSKRSDGKVDQAQIETLEKLKQSYEAAQKAIETRKKLQMAAATVFGGAALVALYQRWSEDGKYASCETGITTALAQLEAGREAALATTPVGTTLAAEYSACILQVNAVQSEIKAYKAKCEAAKGGSMLSFMSTNPVWTATSTSNTTPCVGTGAAATIKSTYVTPACSTYLGESAYNKAYGEPVSKASFNENRFEKIFFKDLPKTKITKEDTIVPPLNLKNYLEKSLDLLFPKAEAGTLSMLGFGAGAIGAYAATHYGMTKTIDAWMYTPGARIIAWGILTAAAMAGASASQKEIDKIKGHISDIDKILNEMNALKAGIKANNVNEQQIRLAGIQTNMSADLALNPNSAVKTDCLTSNSNNGCAPLESQIASMPGFANLPDSFRSIATQSARLGDGLSGTNSISGATLTTAGNLANNANAIAKKVSIMKNKINDNLAKAGKSKVDYEKDEARLLNQLKRDASKGLGSKGLTPSGFLSSIGVSSFNPKEKSAIASIKTPDLKKGAVSGAGAPAAAKKDKGFDLDFKEAGEGDFALAEGAAAGASSGSEAQYDIGQNDINTNSGESIFQMISNRYIKSGYPKLLEEEPVKN